MISSSSTIYPGLKIICSHCKRRLRLSASEFSLTSASASTSFRVNFSSAPQNNENESIPNSTLTFQNDDSVAILTLRNPRRRNALTFSMMEHLDHHVSTLELWSANRTADDASDGENRSRAVILTGVGGNFCSGLDLRDQARPSNDHPFQKGSAMNHHMTLLTNRLRSLPVPSVSAIDGYAVGGGAELSTCTDFVVLSRDARVQFVHARRGASTGWGGGRRLVERVGRSRALKMLLLGQCVLGEEEAKSLSYADGVGEDGESAVEAAMRLIVGPILDLPCSKAIRAIKRMVSAADGDGDVLDSEKKTLLFDSNEALAAERESFVSVWGGESNLEQIRKTQEELGNKTTL